MLNVSQLTFGYATYLISIFIISALFFVWNLKHVKDINVLRRMHKERVGIIRLQYVNCIFNEHYKERFKNWVNKCDRDKFIFQLSSIETIIFIDAINACKEANENPPTLSDLIKFVISYKKGVTK